MLSTAPLLNHNRFNPIGQVGNGIKKSATENCQTSPEATKKYLGRLL